MTLDYKIEREGLLLHKDDKWSTDEERENKPRRGSRRLAVIACVLVVVSTTCALLFAYQALRTDFTSIEAIRATHHRRPMNRQKRLQIAMVATKIDKNVCRTMYSLLANGYEPPHLLRYNQTWNGLLDKVYAADSFFSAQKDNSDLFLFIDAVDVRFQLPESFLLDRYRKMGVDVVLAAEKNCYAGPQESSKEICDKMPLTDLPADMYGQRSDRNINFQRPRYLNTGILLGTVRGLQAVYKEGLAMVNATNGTITNDQSLLARVFVHPDALSRYNLDFKLDHRQTISQQLYVALEDMTWEVNPDERSLSAAVSDPFGTLKLDVSGIKSSSFWRSVPLIRNKILNTIPVLIHFNGGNDQLKISMWWDHFWYSQKAHREVLQATFARDGARGQAGAWNGDKWLSWTALCGNEELF